MGMDVIKVEDTGKGDYARALGAGSDDEVGRVFESVNRGKRSVSLDLKEEAGRAAFYDLVETADVVFEGFRPSVVDRLGIDYAELSVHADELIYCSLSGYGQNGPLADRVGHDLNYAALAGFLDLNRTDEADTPVAPGLPILDMSGGLFAAFCILGALLDRAFGGGGEYIDVSMADVMLALGQYHAGDALRGESSRPGETRLSGAYPCIGVYPTADDRYVTLAALEPQFWAALCQALDRPDLIEYHLDPDPAVREEVRAELEAHFAEQSRDAWWAELGDVDAAFAGVHTLREAVEHPQFQAHDMVVEFDDHPPRLGFPATPSEDPDLAARVPAQGEHTRSVLGDLGYAEAAVEELVDRGAARAP